MNEHEQMKNVKGSHLLALFYCLKIRNVVVLLSNEISSPFDQKLCSGIPFLKNMHYVDIECFVI